MPSNHVVETISPATVTSPGTTTTESIFSQPSRSRRSTNDAHRSKKVAEANARQIQNRISYFKREEAKIWRDLEEVRRQTGKIEDGRSRATEKKQADSSIMQQREHTYYQKRLSAAEQKNRRDSVRRLQQNDLRRSKEEYGHERRMESQTMLQQKRMFCQQNRLRNSERAMMVQRAQLDAKMRLNQDKQERLAGLRRENDISRYHAEKDLENIEKLIPQLEEEEMLCLQRLQNSRIVTQNVLAELEASLGRKSSVSSMLRLQGKAQRNTFMPPDRETHSIAEESSTLELKREYNDELAAIDAGQSADRENYTGGAELAGVQ